METAVLLQESDLRKIIRDAIRTELNLISRNTPLPKEQQEGDIDFAIDVVKVYSKATLYKMTSEGRIPFTRRGKTLWFKRDDLEKWLKEGAGLRRNTAL